MVDKKFDEFSSVVFGKEGSSLVGVPSTSCFASSERIAQPSRAAIDRETSLGEETKELDQASSELLPEENLAAENLASSESEASDGFVESNDEEAEEAEETSEQELVTSGEYSVDPSDDNEEHTWGVPDPSNFKVRGPNYMSDKVKVQSGPSLFSLVTCEFFQSQTDELWHVCASPDSYVQRALACGDTRFKFALMFVAPNPPYKHFMVNYAVPPSIGGGTYPGHDPSQDEVVPEDAPGRVMWNNFLNGDDAYRNSRFKLIPQIADGAWMVRRAVGTRPALLGTKLEHKYYRGERYLELDVNVGSSRVATGVVGVVETYLRTLVIDLGFVLQGESSAELPEQLLGTVRLCKLDVTCAPDRDLV